MNSRFREENDAGDRQLVGIQDVQDQVRGSADLRGSVVIERQLRSPNRSWTRLGPMNRGFSRGDSGLTPVSGLCSPDAHLFFKTRGLPYQYQPSMPIVHESNV